ncbi:MAG: phenylalanine--tRNA ligase subunit beta [Syntrophaceae bacterium]|nr:phenylalanine--tRNA ligase subunit beta [Syntrophaceae bacterium]
MKISLDWLKDYVEMVLSPADLADLLTHSGLEAEGLTQRKASFEGVVVARLDSFRPLPQSDHLSLCSVHDGRRDYSVVCGAPNLKAGERVALAREGAILPGGVKIGRTQFHGVSSEGMLCSEKELGLTEEGSGIMFLDPKAILGLPLDQALTLEDWVLDLNITPNRSDCLCVLGIAREVAALTGKPLRFPADERMEKDPPADRLTSVVLERPDLCPRYVAKLILGVKIGPSPFWMRRRLEACGVRAISNIVDVTNYVMLEMGQPLHAFDFNRLEEKRIVVRTAAPGFTFTTLDGTGRRMPKDALMICDGKKPVALAGIMGGLNSEVETDTRDILLESAYFDPMGIRRTSKQLGLSTEASTRFERGIDPNGALRAAERAAGLMAALAGGTISKGAVDAYPRKIEPLQIPLRVSRVNQILGTSISAQEVRNSLTNLQLGVWENGANSFRVKVPTYRVDLTREIDLVEEVARLHGFHRVPVTLPSGRVSPRKKTPMQVGMGRARNLLTGFGFWEVITYSFISPQVLLDLQISPSDKKGRALPIRNPLSEEQAVMRTTLVPGLLQTVRTNIHRQNLDLKLFELGRVFFPRGPEDLPEEVEVLGGVLCGLREEESWAKARAECDFFDLKGTLEGLFEGMGLSKVQFLRDDQIPFLQPGKACSVRLGEEDIGILGEVNPGVGQLFGLKDKVFLFELNFQAMVARMTERRTFTPLPRYPAVARDLAVVVDEPVPAGDILQTLWKADEGWIKEIRLFDLYRGNPVPPGRKSLAFRLVYQKEDRTLTDREVNEFHQKLVDLLAREYQGALR